MNVVSLPNCCMCIFCVVYDEAYTSMNLCAVDRYIGFKTAVSKSPSHRIEVYEIPKNKHLRVVTDNRPDVYILPIIAKEE